MGKAIGKKEAKNGAAKDGAKEAAEAATGKYVATARDISERAKAAACMVLTSWGLGVVMETWASKTGEARIGRGSMHPRLADIFDLFRFSSMRPQYL